MDRIVTIEEAASRVPDGSTIALGGLSMNSSPMALVRELVRQHKKELTVIAIVNGMAVDWLIAGGCVRKVVSGLVSFEGMGLAPHFRRAVETGKVAFEEYSEYLLIARLKAESACLPFFPVKAGLGTDIIGLHPDTTRLEHDRVTGEAYVACTPLPVDIALVHAHAADERGNVRVDPKLLWMDNELVNAASSTIVSVETMVPNSEFVAEPHRTSYPRFMIDAVAEARWGAWPTSCFPDYIHDKSFYSDYSRAATDAERFAQFWSDRIAGPGSHGAFLEANGGSEALERLRSAPA